MFPDYVEVVYSRDTQTTLVETETAIVAGVSESLGVVVVLSVVEGFDVVLQA